MTAVSRGKRLRREADAIAALLSEPTIAAAARKAGVGESTLLRWMATASFRAEYRAARRQVVEQAVARLQQATSDAVDCLQRNLTCGIPAVEVGAARTVLDQAIRAVELIDLADRVDALEQAAVQESRLDQRAPDVIDTSAWQTVPTASGSPSEPVSQLPRPAITTALAGHSPAMLHETVETR